jgi:Fe-Mn family superoxide dismutase
MTYSLPLLAYEYGALEPYIDARTMEIHYTMHHGGYVNNLNKLLAGVKTLENKTLEEIIADIRMVPEDIRQAVRNHGGGHLNHSLFWHILGPGGGGEPRGVISTAILGTFESFAKFKDVFTKAALGRFGSGWAWLCMESHGRLEVLDTPNQDSPIMQGLRPILGLDLWEHAYYLKYQSRRAEYVDAWWNVVSWPKVNEIYMHHLELVTRPK